MKRNDLFFWSTILLATVMLWWRGEAWVLDGEGQGYRWPDYIYNAWMVDLQASQLYDPFRNPLHGFVVAKLGRLVGSYNNAAILISSLSIWMVVFSSAHTVRMWVGAVGGGTVALLIAMSLPVADASQWGNLYPMLAGGIALCVWASSYVWIKGKGMVIAGFLGGYAWAIDPRALPFVLLIVCSVAWNGVRKRAIGSMLLSLLLLWGGYSLHDGFGMASNHHLKTDDYVLAQKEVVIARMNSHNNPVLTQKCQNVDPEIVFTPQLLETACGQEMLQENLDVGVPRQLTLPIFVVALFSGFFLIPGKLWVGRVLIVGCVWGTALISFATMAIEERYMILNTGPMMTVCILGVMWILSSVTPFRKTSSLIAVGLVLWGWSLDGTRQELGGTPGTRDSPNNRIWNKSARFVQRKIPEEARFLDCSAQSVNLSLLPQKTIDGIPPALFKHMMTSGVAEYCIRWLSRPPSDHEAYFGIGPMHWQDSSGTSKPHYEAVLKALESKRSWKKVGNTPYYSLYRYNP
ncbi:MAG: hypothetical protein CL916_01755 [Deltaproteobacteria bacterium]|nr:hypothetical protein [Deltaproteobacteria bacterium]